MMKIWITIALMFTTLFLSAKTVTVEIAFPGWPNPTIEVAQKVIDDLNKVYQSTGIDFVLYRATDGSNVKLSKSIEMTWARNNGINTSGADILLILTQSHTGNTVGYATIGMIGTNKAVAVYDYTSSDNISGIAHEIGHLFGLRHVTGEFVMNSLVTDDCSVWCGNSLELLQEYIDK